MERERALVQSGEMGEETASALRDFRMDKNLPVTGQVDEATANDNTGQNA